jgi:hypothetical protein
MKKRPAKKHLKTCRRAHKVIMRDELEAMMVLALRQNQDRGEKRYYPCFDHYHLTSEEKIAA